MVDRRKVAPSAARSTAQRRHAAQRAAGTATPTRDGSARRCHLVLLLRRSAMRSAQRAHILARASRGPIADHWIDPSAAAGVAAPPRDSGSVSSDIAACSTLNHPLSRDHLDGPLTMCKWGGSSCECECIILCQAQAYPRISQNIPEYPRALAPTLYAFMCFVPSFLRSLGVQVLRASTNQNAARVHEQGAAPRFERYHTVTTLCGNTTSRHCYHVVTPLKSLLPQLW